MRINGFEQIKAFYTIVFSQEYDMKPQHISLYVFLVNQNNRNNWVEWFKCPFDLAMTGACIGSKKTYYSCLDDLQRWNFIKYEKGENLWKSPKIKLEVLKSTSTVPQSEQVDTQLTVQVDAQVDIQLPTHIYKLITSNLQLVTSNIDRWIKNELKKKPEIPNFKDFHEYAKTLKPYKPELDFAIEAKYNSWIEDGWQDGNGKIIRNWKTKFQNTITFLKPTFEGKKTLQVTYGNNRS